MILVNPSWWKKAKFFLHVPSYLWGLQVPRWRVVLINTGSTSLTHPQLVWSKWYNRLAESRSSHVWVRSECSVPLKMRLSLLLTEINISVFFFFFDVGETRLTVQFQGPFANDFWAAPNRVLNVCNIHKQLYTVQLGRQRCTGLSDRFAWLSTWDPKDDEGDGSPARERMCTMDDFHYSITALHTHTHPITAGINWSSYLFLFLCNTVFFFMNTYHSFQSFCFTALQPQLYMKKRRKTKSLRGHFHVGGVVREKPTIASNLQDRME